MSLKVRLVCINIGLSRGMIWFNLDLCLHITLSCSVNNSCTVPDRVRTVVTSNLHYIQTCCWRDNLLSVYSLLDSCYHHTLLSIIMLFKLFQMILIADSYCGMVTTVLCNGHVLRWCCVSTQSGVRCVNVVIAVSLYQIVAENPRVTLSLEISMLLHCC